MLLANYSFGRGDQKKLGLPTSDLAELRAQAADETRSPDTGEVLTQVEKLLASPPFEHSDSNRQLLRFLADYAVSHPGQPLKEIELATSVYGLSLETFDPQLDSAVRVKVGRLRSKISEYYAHQGTQDPVILEIPRGAYCLVSRYRKEEKTESSVALLPPAVTEPVVEVVTVAPGVQRPRYLWWVLCVVLSMIVGGGATYFWMRHDATALPKDDVSRFWNAFYKRDQPVVAVFSNPRLGGKLAHGGLHYFEDATATGLPDFLNLGYAGAGDVHAIYLLTRLFERNHWDLNLRSGALLSWDTAKAANLVFIGRPEQNPALQKLPLLRDFYFKFDSGIINAHPQAGESSAYHSEEPFDYAIIAFIPGFDPQGNTLVLAGNTTWGSQAATECVTKNSCLESLFSRLGVGKEGPIPYFEAVLKIRVNNDIPVWSTVVAQRRYTADYTSWVSPAPEDR
jgi:hypothetical protein